MTEIVLRGKLPSLNEVIGAARRNPYQANKQKRDTEALIASQLPSTQIQERNVFTFEWHEPSKRRDPDNIASAVKFIFDAMQKQGVLANDGWGQVAEIHHKFIYDKENSHYVVINYHAL